MSSTSAYQTAGLLLRGCLLYRRLFGNVGFALSLMLVTFFCSCKLFIAVFTDKILIILLFLNAIIRQIDYCSRHRSSWVTGWVTCWVTGWVRHIVVV